MRAKYPKPYFTGMFSAIIPINSELIGYNNNGGTYYEE